MSLSFALVAASFASDTFVDVAAERGITFRLENGAAGKKYLVETMVGGAAWIDFDRDGFQDLYLVQAHRHPERALDGPGASDEPGDVLYRNVAGTRFEDVTARAGLGDRGYGMGAAVGDFDRDGWPDLYVTNYGRNTLSRNKGDGSFEEVTARAGVAGGGFSTSATWADFDGDGWLDLFVARYLDYDVRKHSGCPGSVRGSKTSELAYCHPHHFEGTADLLFRNRGDGTFEDQSQRSGIAASHGWLQGKGLGVVACDFDSDGDPDLFVSNDSVPNTLWRNQGGMRFEDVGLETGFALCADGVPRAGMGIDRGDIDGDGLFDVYVTNFSRETDTLYLNQGGLFFDGTVERGLARATYLPLAFGTRFVDFDLDGDLDLYVGNGHILDNAERLNPGEGIVYRQSDFLFENDGRGFFKDRSGASGAWFSQKKVTRAIVECDYDNDGDPDLLVTRIGEGPSLLENRAGDGKPWLGIELRAEPGDPAVENARVEIEAAGSKYVREAQRDGSYLAAHDPRLRFALPAGATKAALKIRWPGMKEPQRVEGLAPGRYHTLRRPR